MSCGRFFGLNSKCHGFIPPGTRHSRKVDNFPGNSRRLWGQQHDERRETHVVCNQQFATRTRSAVVAIELRSIACSNRINLCLAIGPRRSLEHTRRSIFSCKAAAKSTTTSADSSGPALHLLVTRVSARQRKNRRASRGRFTWLASLAFWCLQRQYQMRSEDEMPRGHNTGRCGS